MTALSSEEQEAIHSTLFRLETRWHDGYSDDTHHSWDSLPFWLFLDGIRAAAAITDGRRFLDVGCGIGTKLATMHHLGWSISGIDRHQPYIDAACELVPEATLTCADAFDADAFDADLVYLYRPMKSDEDEDALEQHVLEHVQPGTVMFFPTRRTPEVWVA